jgi:predicted PurR-regulated permease PerM
VNTVATTSPVSYVAPKISTAIQPVVKAVQSYNPVQTLQNNVQQAQKAVQSYNPVQTFQTNVQSAKNAVQNIGTTIKNTASNIWNKLKWW